MVEMELYYAYGGSSYYAYGILIILFYILIPSSTSSFENVLPAQHLRSCNKTLAHYY